LFPERERERERERTRQDSAEGTTDLDRGDDVCNVAAAGRCKA